LITWLAGRSAWGRYCGTVPLGLAGFRGGLSVGFAGLSWVDYCGVGGGDKGMLMGRVGR